MHSDYTDIKSRISEEPTWYDCHGVPRYGKFDPMNCPDIYATDIVLLEIACQDCRTRFLVEMHWSIMHQVFDKHSESFTNVMRIWLKNKDKEYGTPFHYGDPPLHGCVGDTMNCFDLRIVEFWHKERFEWKRITEYEVELEKGD